MTAWTANDARLRHAGRYQPRRYGSGLNDAQWPDDQLAERDDQSGHDDAGGDHPAKHHADLAWRAKPRRPCSTKSKARAQIDDPQQLDHAVDQQWHTNTRRLSPITIGQIMNSQSLRRHESARCGNLIVEGGSSPDGPPFFNCNLTGEGCVIPPSRYRM